jgi:hypothetical protein
MVPIFYQTRYIILIGALLLAGCSRFTGGSEEWKLVEETDKLTNKKTIYLGYHSSNVQSKVYCNKYARNYEIWSEADRGTFKLKGTYVIPNEVLTILDTPQPLLKRERDYDGVIKNFLFARSIYNNELEYTIGYIQSSEYSNKFNREMFNPHAALTKLVAEGRRGNWDEGWDEYHISIIPKSTEITMSDGTKHIIKYNADFQKFYKKCIEKDYGQFQ